MTGDTQSSSRLDTNTHTPPPHPHPHPLSLYLSLSLVRLDSPLSHRLISLFGFPFSQFGNEWVTIPHSFSDFDSYYVWGRWVKTGHLSVWSPFSPSSRVCTTERFTTPSGFCFRDCQSIWDINSHPLIPHLLMTHYSLLPLSRKFQKGRKGNYTSGVGYPDFGWIHNPKSIFLDPYTYTHFSYHPFPSSGTDIEGSLWRYGTHMGFRPQPSGRRRILRTVHFGNSNGYQFRFF